MMGMPGMMGPTQNLSDPEKCEPEKLDEGNASQKRATRFYRTKYCSQNQMACGGKDETGNFVPPEEVCLRLSVCPKRESLADVPRTVINLVKNFERIIKKLTTGIKKEVDKEGY